MAEMGAMGFITVLEEVRPALRTYDNAHVMVHTLRVDQNGEYICELEDGRITSVSPIYLRFLDSKDRFAEYCWEVRA